MSVSQPAPTSQPPNETAEEKARRLAREAEMIAEARASVAVGRVVSFEAVLAWIDSLGTVHELPVPQSPAADPRLWSGA